MHNGVDGAPPCASVIKGALSSCVARGERYRKWTRHLVSEWLAKGIPRSVRLGLESSPPVSRYLFVASMVNLGILDFGT